MTTLFEIGIFPVILTLGAFRLGQLCQSKWKKPIFNPTLVASLLVIGFVLISGMDLKTYTSGNSALSWLMTPATIALAIPMYQQFQELKKNLKAIAIGVAAGTVSSLVMLLLGGILLGMDKTLIVSLMPKSVTTAIGVVLSQLQGGLAGITTAAIIVTGIFANMAGTALCKLFHLTHPVAQGVAFGTSGHVIGTARANEVGPLVGAVSSLSLVVAGLMTAILFPLLTGLL